MDAPGAAGARGSPAGSRRERREAYGASIPIEERGGTEVSTHGGRSFALPGVGARNPAFDVTPARLLTGIVTDRGVLRPPFATAIKAALAAGR